MKVLLCLLSGQHVPNLLSVHHFQPDQLVLVESADMKKRNTAKNFLEALRLGQLDYDRRCDVAALEAEDDLEAMRVTLRKAYGKYPTAEWTANVTGGTKPMSIATFEFFKATAGNIVYTNFSRPDTFLFLDSSNEEQCDHKLTIKEFMAGYGFEFRKKDEKVREAEERAEKWASCAREITKLVSSEDLLQLSGTDRGEARKKGWDIQPGQLKVCASDIGEAIRKTFELNGNTQDSLQGHADKYAIDFLTGGWLEVFFWNTLTHHADALGIWDVRLGLDVGRHGDSSGNEFDVTFMRNHGLAMLECKSGTQDHDQSGNVLYKVEAVTRQFRALRVQSFLATTSGNVLGKDGELKSSIRNRASIYNCRIITTTEIKQIAKSDTVPEIRKLLFNATETLE